MKVNKIIKRIYKLDSLDKEKVLAKFTKLIEETGELGAEILLLEGYKYNKENKSEVQIKLDALDECADIFIMLMVVSKTLGFDFKDIIKSSNRKLNKWEFQIKNN